MRNHTLAVLLIFIGGGLGSTLRHGVNQASAAMFGVNLGWGTIFVNILGSFVMGALAGWFPFRLEGGQLLRLFLTTGLLGGFTTFSAFSLDAILLWERNQVGAAILYVVSSVGFGLAGFVAGLTLVRDWLS